MNNGESLNPNRSLGFIRVSFASLVENSGDNGGE